MQALHLRTHSQCPLFRGLQVQIIRIQLRVPEYGWTTQKVFHLLNFIVCGVRAGVFGFRQQVQDLDSMVAHAFLLDLPGNTI